MSDEPDAYEMSDIPPPVKPPPELLEYAGKREVLPYARPKPLEHAQLDARLGWQGNARFGSGVYVLAMFCVAGTYCSGGWRIFPHPLAAAGLVSLALAGVGLYAGLKNGAWGFLIGTLAAATLAAAIVGLLWSICGL